MCVILGERLGGRDSFTHSVQPVCSQVSSPQVCFHSQEDLSGTETPPEACFTHVWRTHTGSVGIAAVALGEPSKWSGVFPAPRSPSHPPPSLRPPPPQRTANLASEATRAVLKSDICRAVQRTFFLSGFVCLLLHIKLVRVFPATSV